MGVVYVYVLPTLESRLRDEKIATLRTDASRYAVQLRPTIGTSMPEKAVERLVSEVAQQVNARVTLLNVPSGPLTKTPIPVADSAGDITDSGLGFGVAARAAQTHTLATGTEAGQSGRVAEAAQPIVRGSRVRVVVFSSPLNEVTDTVRVIRSRVLVAAGLALLVALIGGWLVARALSSRIKRLERAAGRVAAGDFGARFPVDHPDELGELAMALDDMQRQLAQLDSARKRFI